MSKILNLFLFIVLAFNYSYQCIVLNFKTNIDLNKLNDENYMNTTFDQKLYVNLNIGDSHQIIPMTLKTQQLPTYVVSSCSEDNISIKYNETQSLNSFHKITNYLIEKLYKYDFISGYLVNDTLSFNSSLAFNNFTYMLATKINIMSKNISGEIGLSIKKQEEYPYSFPDRTQFLEQLKDNKLIKNKIFGIVYDTEYEGRLFLGSYLHRVDELYNEDEMITNNIEDIKDDNRDKWHINFNVKLTGQQDNEEVYVEEDTYGLIMYEIGLIVGSSSFREKFLEKYFKDKGCIEEMISSKPFGFYQYSCDKKEQFSDFPDIFFSIPGKYMFNFTKNELFKKIGKKYVFQIVFEIIDLEINYWRLGQFFFRKYNTFFNWNEKQSTFSYYPVKHIKNQEKKISFQIILIIILSASILCLFGIIIYFYLFWEKKKKKKKAQELKEDEEYDYTPAENIIQDANKKILNESA
jgi:hypothetical protein